jgi:hypothetical protein
VQVVFVIVLPYGNHYNGFDWQSHESISMIPAALAWEEFKDTNRCSGWRWGMITKAMKKLQTSPRDD